MRYIHLCLKNHLVPILSVLISFAVIGTLFAQGEGPESAKQRGENARKIIGEKSVTEIFSQNLTDMIKENDRGANETGSRDWQQVCNELGAPGADQGKKAEAVKLMTEAIEKPENAPAHHWLLKQLAQIGDASCVEAVGKFLDSENVRDREAGLRTLGMLPCEEAQKMLEKKLSEAKDKDRNKAIQDVIVFRMRNFAPEKSPANDRSKKMAEYADSLGKSNDKLGEIVKMLSGEDEIAWGIAIETLSGLKTVKIIDVSEIEQKFASMKPDAQILFLAVLSSKEDRSAKPLALTALKSEDESVMLAAYSSLAGLGDTSTLPLLVEKVRAGGQLEQVARSGIRMATFPGSDEAIVKVFNEEKNDDIKRELIEIMKNRKSTYPVATLQKFAEQTDKSHLRNAAISAIGEIGDDNAVAPLVRMMLREDKDGLRNELDRAIVNIANASGEDDRRAKAFSDEFQKRTDSEKTILLPTFGKIGGKAAYDVVVPIWRNGTPALKAAALRALSNWPDAGVADELYKIAADKNSPEARNALRAYIRIVTLRDEGRRTRDSLELFKKALALCDRDEEKNLLIGRTSTARSIEVVEFVAPFLENEATAQEACRAIVDMANDHGFHMNNRAKIDPQLDKILEICKDQGRKDHAKRLRDR